VAGARVLIVDDDPDIRRLVAEVLRLGGHEPEEAPNGLEALTRLRSGARPDLVLLDVQMPDLDGWDTLRTLRAIEHLADVPVVLCTVKAGPNDVLRGWELGCDGYLGKPFAISELRAEVDAVIARSVAERHAHRAEVLKALGGVAPGR
jgi:DNA-binding response OmpR family regulator